MRSRVSFNNRGKYKFKCDAKNIDTVIGLLLVVNM